VILKSKNGAIVSACNGTLGPNSTAVKECAKWSYGTPGTITKVSPVFGQVGTVVEITGGNLQGYGNDALASVSLAGIEATIVNQSSSLVSVIASRSDKQNEGTITLTTLQGTTVTKVSSWDYLEPSVLTSVLPNFGQQGTRVVLVGERLRGGGSKIVDILIGNKKAVYSNESANGANIIAPLLPPGKYNVTVVADSGATTVSENAYTAVDESVVTNVVPKSGQEGTLVTIFGRNLLGGGSSISEATLVGRSARVMMSNDSVVVLQAMQGPFGVELGSLVLVANTGAHVDALDAWTYKAAGKISDVTPSRGAAGTRVTIQGDNLFGGGTNVSEVKLGGLEATVLHSESHSSKIVVISDGTSNGTTPSNVIVMSNTGAIVYIEKSWSYVTPGNILSIFPPQGQIGTKITIRGTNLWSGSTGINLVLLGGVSASVEYSSNTEIQAVASHKEEGSVDVTLVSNDAASVTAPSGWKYLAKGEVEKLSSDVGIVGTRVNITGVRLLGGGNKANRVLLGGTECIVKTSSNELISVVVNGVGQTNTDVKIIADTGAVIQEANVWNYSKTPGLIKSISPSSGQEGTYVNVNGDDLFGDGVVVVSATLAGTPARIIFSTSNSTRLQAERGYDVGVGDVVLTVDTGGKVTHENAWEYKENGKIIALTPAYGQKDTNVIISGTNLRGYGGKIVSVTLDGLEAQNIVQQNDEFIIITAPKGPTGGSKGDIVVTSDTGAVVRKELAWEYVC
jgi:hypothetical protein